MLPENGMKKNLAVVKSEESGQWGMKLLAATKKEMLGSSDQYVVLVYPQPFTLIHCV